MTRRSPKVLKTARYRPLRRRRVGQHHRRQRRFKLLGGRLIAGKLLATDRLLHGNPIAADLLGQVAQWTKTLATTETRVQSPRPAGRRTGRTRRRSARTNKTRQRIASLMFIRSGPSPGLCLATGGFTLPSIQPMI